jgi:hypothetical protein
MLTRTTVSASNLFLAALLSLSTGTVGQDATAHSTKRPTASVAVVGLSLKEDKTAPRLSASPVMTYPVRCTADGTAYLEMLQPPDYSYPKRRLVSISAKEVHEFVLQAITDLKHVEAIDYFPSESEVAFLVHGTTGSEEVTRTFTLPDGEKLEEKWPKAEIHAYVARFDPAGKYLGVTQLEDEIEPHKLAIFPSGNFLVWGLERVTKSPRLVLVGSSGEMLRYLEVPAKFDNDLAHQDNSPTRVGERSMVDFRGGVLLIRPFSNAPLLWVRESGAVETISLNVPEGAVIDSVLPSDGHLYVRLRQAQTKTDEAAHKIKGEPELYQFNADNGKPVAKYIGADYSISELACVVDGRFIAFRRDDNGNLVRMIGR